MRTLRDRGVDAVGMDARPSPWTDVVGRVQDPVVVREAMDGADTVLHTATLHKPQVAFLPAQAFIEANVGGTSTLLAAAGEVGVSAFVMTSSTTVFGDALVPPPDQPAGWIDESVVPVAKNIYGVTKRAAEDLCRLGHRNDGLNCVVLRTSRFFPELDDSAHAHGTRSDENVKADEYAYRRVALEDVVSAHLLAAERAPDLGYALYVISATTPFTVADMADLRVDAAAVFARRAPRAATVWGERGWRFPHRIDRVYANTRALRELGWRPHFDLDTIADRVATHGTIRTPLADLVGSKPYADSTYHLGEFTPAVR